LFGEALFNVGSDVRGFEDSLIGGFGVIVVLNGFRTDSLFREEFDRGAEEVMKESGFMAIEVIEERDNVGMI
jgi:hypothetical protein